MSKILETSKLLFSVAKRARSPFVMWGSQRGRKPGAEPKRSKPQNAALPGTKRASSEEAASGAPD